jgi:DNA polymerase
MKTDEKKAIFDFLQKSWYTTTGYPPADYFDDHNWTDDAPPQKNSVPSVVQTSVSSVLLSISQEVSLCQKCPLSQTRTRTVPGVGVPRPLVMVIGEGPGEEEDRQGVPFVGRAGQLLDKMLAAIHLSRTANCYIANIVKCRPPGNRNPLPEEEDACAPFLREQIAALQPRFLLAMGGVAAKYLLHTEEGITRLRGRFFDYPSPGGSIPLMPTFHPSYLLRSPDQKAAAWADLKTFARRLLEYNPDYAKA